MGRLYVEGTRVTVCGNTVTRVPSFQCSTPASQMGNDCQAVNGCAAHSLGSDLTANHRGSPGAQTAGDAIGSSERRWEE